MQKYLLNIINTDNINKIENFKIRVLTAKPEIM
jgi:hypothetical protein